VNRAKRNCDVAMSGAQRANPAKRNCSEVTGFQPVSESDSVPTLHFFGLENEEEMPTV